VRVGLDVLRRFVDLPADAHQVRVLLDECGLEVKRVEHDGVDTCFTLELLANRGDHYCYEGLARELHGRTGAAFRPLAPPPLTVGPSPVPVRIETELCSVYTTTLLEGQGGALAPVHLRALTASGLDSISAAVDATNLANLELGQPTHAFDAETLEGAVCVRLSRPGESAWPLFAAGPVELPANTIVIADDRKILGIAGVIGCEESKATAATRRLLVESATFDPVAVRKASRALQLSTDASARFERGADPARPLTGAARVAELLGTVGWKTVGPSGQAGAWTDPQRTIALHPDRVRAFLALQLSDDELAERLARYGFAAERSPREAPLAVRVPPWRLWDVSLVADLYEEVAKSVGYAAIPAGLPAIDRGALPSADEDRRTRVEEVLLGAGFYEVFTDGFYGRDVFSKLGLAADEPLGDHLATTNAMDRGYALLKNNTLHQAIEAVAVNERRKTSDVKLFEFTRTFHPVRSRISATGTTGREASPCEERSVLWLAVAGRDREKAWHDTSRPADVWFLRGLLTELGVTLGRELSLAHAADSAHPLARFLHPGRRAVIRVGGEPVGILGEVHPAVARRYKLKAARPCFVELDWPALCRPGARPRYVEPPQTQALVRSLALELPTPLEAGDVAQAIRTAGPTWLERVAIVDLYAPPPAEGSPPVRSVTYELQFSNPDASRTADEVNAAVDGILDAVLASFGPRGVRQR
jgi:phenylalanyl-tRNA synthetase beta chain